jgi:hypothetical protein
VDKILKALQNNAFHLAEVAYEYLGDRYDELVGRPIPDVRVEGMHPGAIREIIRLHRAQFHSPEYVQSRISNPVTGTIDHLHAEITAAIAVRLGIGAGYDGYAVELVRAAGHLHDSDRAFPRRMIMGEETTRHDKNAYSEYKKEHAENSWRIAEELLGKAAAAGYTSPPGLAHDLRYLILRHELGGEKSGGANLPEASEIDPDLNLNDLTDIVTGADSLSYFDANILTNWEECGRDKTLLGNKVRFMFDRLTPATQDELRNTILFSEHHILGSPSDDSDLQSIRDVVLQVCS